MGRKRKPDLTSFDSPKNPDLAFHDYLIEQPKRRSKPRNREEWKPVVTDDFDGRLPITERELDLIEIHFKEFLDELFSEAKKSKRKAKRK